MAFLIYRFPIQRDDVDLADALLAQGESSVDEVAQYLQEYFENPDVRATRPRKAQLFARGIEVSMGGVMLLPDVDEVSMESFDSAPSPIEVRRSGDLPSASLRQDLDHQWYEVGGAEDVPVIKVIHGVLVFKAAPTEKDLVELEVDDVLKDINAEADLFQRFFEGDQQLAHQELGELGLRIQTDRERIIVGEAFIHRFDLEALDDFPIQNILIQSGEIPMPLLTRGSDGLFYDKKDITKGPVKSIEGTTVKFVVEANQEVKVAQPLSLSSLLQQVSMGFDGDSPAEAETFQRASWLLAQRGITVDMQGVTIELSCEESISLDDFAGLDSVMFRRPGQHALQISRGSDDLWYVLGFEDQGPVESVEKGSVQYLELPPQASGISSDISRPQASLVDQIQELRHYPAEGLSQHLNNRGISFDENNERITVQAWSRRLTMDTFAQEDFFFMYLRLTDHEIDNKIQLPYKKIVKQSDRCFYVEGREKDGPVEAVEKGVVYFSKEVQEPQPVLSENYSGTDTETLLVSALRQDEVKKPLQDELQKRGVDMKINTAKRERSHSALTLWGKTKAKGVKSRVGRVLNWLMAS